MGRRLEREIGNRERLEARIARMTLALTEAERERDAAEQDQKRLHEELTSIEARVGNLLAREIERGRCDAENIVPGQSEPEALAPALPQLAGSLVLYVGGRPNQVPQLKALVERAGGVFLYHDGGIEHSSATLPGLVSRAFTIAMA